MLKTLRIFGWSAVALGFLMLACGLAGMTDRGQQYLRGPNYIRDAKAAKERGDTAAVQAAAFHDDDTAMGAGLLPFVLVIAAALTVRAGNVSLRAARSRVSHPQSPAL